MKLLFLDFDGVLHDGDAVSIEYEGAGVSITGEDLFRYVPTLVNELAGYPDVRIAISSSWRRHYPLADLIDRLGPLGKRVIGATPYTRKGRYWDCAAFAADCQCTDWVMLDDQALSVFLAFTPTAEQRACLLLCDINLALDTPGVLDDLRTWLTQ